MWKYIVMLFSSIILLAHAIIPHEHYLHDSIEHELSHQKASTLVEYLELALHHSSQNLDEFVKQIPTTDTQEINKLKKQNFILVLRTLVYWDNFQYTGYVFHTTIHTQYITLHTQYNSFKPPPLSIIAYIQAQTSPFYI